MLSKIEIDKQSRFFFNKVELVYKLFKAIPNNSQAIKILHILPKKARLVHLRGTCVETFRSRAVLKAFKLSRIVLHKKGSKNILNYLQKASW